MSITVQVFSDYVCPYCYILPMAARLGVEINRPSRAPLTRLAHEAAAWARSQGRFDPFHKGLFRVYFVLHFVHF